MHRTVLRRFASHLLVVTASYLVELSVPRLRLLLETVYGVAVCETLTSVSRLLEHNGL